MNATAMLLAGAGEIVAIASAVSVVTAVGVWAFWRLLPRSEPMRRSGVLLGEATARDVGYLAAPPRDELVGAVGRVLTDLRPAGTAEFGDERLDVVAESEWIPAGSRVRVIRSEGYRHVVRSVPDGD